LPGEAERGLRQRLAWLKGLPLLHRTGVSGDEKRLRRQLDSISRSDASEAEIWSFVELARHSDRPYTLDYVSLMLDDWVELHGDRGRMDDGAIVAGLGKLDGRTVALVGHQKGRDAKERVHRQFGMPSPEGYAKAIRVMEIAERFGYPVIALIDTPGAYPGVAAEQHGQGGAIARSQARMLALDVPTIACVIGEGGSGGALALAVADQVLMQENAIYSVISPEGCAMILWRDRDEKKKAAAAFKPDAFHCLELGVIDGIVPEPGGGAQSDPAAAAESLKRALTQAIADLEGASPAELRRARRAKFRAMGVYA
jgi:acetyl-CoA carboxylase carboxyl transferase subunit alpha